MRIETLTFAQLHFFRDRFHPEYMQTRAALRDYIMGKRSHVRINYGLQLIRILQESLAEHNKILDSDFAGDIYRITRMIEKLIIPELYDYFRRQIKKKYPQETKESLLRRTHEKVHKTLKKYRY